MSRHFHSRIKWDEEENWRKNFSWVSHTFHIYVKIFQFSPWFNALDGYLKITFVTIFKFMTPQGWIYHSKNHGKKLIKNGVEKRLSRLSIFFSLSFFLLHIAHWLYTVCIFITPFSQSNSGFVFFLCSRFGKNISHSIVKIISMTFFPCLHLVCI